MIFVDPKGIRNLGNFSDPKIQLCASDIKEIENRVREELKRKGEIVNIKLEAFIISVSKYDDIKKTWEDGRFSDIDYKDAEEEFNKYNILFQEDETYVQKILEKAGVVKND